MFNRKLKVINGGATTLAANNQEHEQPLKVNRVKMQRDFRKAVSIVLIAFALATAICTVTLLSYGERFVASVQALKTWQSLVTERFDQIAQDRDIMKTQISSMAADIAALKSHQAKDTHNPHVSTKVSASSEDSDFDIVLKDSE
jgi:hypothetical protein